MKNIHRAVTTLLRPLYALSIRVHGQDEEEPRDMSLPTLRGIMPEVKSCQLLARVKQRLVILTINWYQPVLGTIDSVRRYYFNPRAPDFKFEKANGDCMYTILLFCSCYFWKTLQALKRQFLGYQVASKLKYVFFFPSVHKLRGLMTQKDREPTDVNSSSCFSAAARASLFCDQLRCPPSINVAFHESFTVPVRHV